MYHPARKKRTTYTISTIVIQVLLYATLNLSHTQAKSFDASIIAARTGPPEDFDNNAIDFDDDYLIKISNKYDKSDSSFEKESHRYTIIKNHGDKLNNSVINEAKFEDSFNVHNVTDNMTTQNYNVIPLELQSTTENKLISILESTTEADLTVIPLSTTKRIPRIEVNDTATLPSSTHNYEATTYYTTTEQEANNEELKLTVIPLNKAQNLSNNNEATTQPNVELIADPISPDSLEEVITYTENFNETTTIESVSESEVIKSTSILVTLNSTVNMKYNNKSLRSIVNSTTSLHSNESEHEILNKTVNNNEDRSDPANSESGEEVPIFTELDTDEEKDIPEDYYDAKDVVPTTAPRTDALSVIFGLAGSVVESVVESVAERVVPKGIFDLFKRMQRQNEALEAEKLRSREENGGIGHFTRGIIKSISTGISKPLSQLISGVRDFGSLDTDRGFVSSIASGVTSVANVAYSVADAFKDRVQAIYPGTVWCGDGRSATARSSDLGLFFFTDTCCRQHDACKLYIKAGETKYGLTNTGLFTRSHCSCDTKFRECLRQTNSLVSSQIGLTYFNVLGPQCFRRAHPIVRCVRRTRITGLKCEEYELDYTKPRMWQWFDNETF